MGRRWSRPKRYAQNMAVRSSKWPLAIGLILLVLLRWFLLSGSVDRVFPVNGVHEQQVDLAEVWCEGAQEGRLAYFLENTDRFLPEVRQFHGALLLNNMAVATVSSISGHRFTNLHAVALGYLCIVFLCWGMVLGQALGRRAQWAWVGLFVFAPLDYVSAGLNLIGSHTEGAALIAVMFWLALGGGGRHRLYWLLGLFGTFFFLYKGVLLALVVLAPRVLSGLRGLGAAARGAGILLAGFLPSALYYLRYGFHSQYLADKGPEPVRLDWSNLFFNLHFQSDKVQLPALRIDLLGEGQLADGFLPVLLLGALGLVLVRWLKGDFPKSASFLVGPLLGFFVVHLSALSFSNLMPQPRYYWLLYPLCFVVMTIALSGLGRVVGPALTLGLVVLLAVNTFLGLSVSVQGVASDYRGVDYYRAGLAHVPAGEVAWVNAWLEECPDNRGPSFLYAGMVAPHTWIRENPFGPGHARGALGNLIESGQGRDEEFQAFAALLANRFDGDLSVYDYVTEGRSIPESFGSAYHQGRSACGAAKGAGVRVGD